MRTSLRRLSHLVAIAGMVLGSIGSTTPPMTAQATPIDSPPIADPHSISDLAHSATSAQAIRVPLPIETKQTTHYAIRNTQYATIHIPLPSETQQTPNDHTIHLKSRAFQPSTPDTASLQRLARPERDRVHVLAQLDFIPRQAAKDELRARGLNLLAYVPDYAWIASVSAIDPAAALQLPGVTWIGELAVDDKIDLAIAAGEWGSYNLAPDGTAAVYVAMHRDETLETGRALVDAHGGKVAGEAQGIGALVVEMPAGNIRALAAEDAVQWIEPAEPALGEANDGIRQQIGVDIVQAAPYSLSGADVDILIYDGGIVTPTHADFAGRLTIGAGEASGVSDHATHVAGTAAGSGSLSVSAGGSPLQWRGMAPGARIISYAYNPNGQGALFYNDPGDIEADWAAAQNTYGADVGSASLSSNIYANYPLSCTHMGNYGLTSVLLDQIIRGGNAPVGVGDKTIATWAAGNERGSPSSCGAYATTSPPSAAKNPIHVGASNTNDNSMTSFSSWGPTDDGRLKPIVVAGGGQIGGDGGIKSTIPNRFTNAGPRNCDGSGDDYCYPYDVMFGTSMATPAVAGSIALMLEHYRDVYGTTGNFWPSTAKAILVQTARDFGNPGPDYQWGYGQVDIRAAVDLITRRAFTQDSVAHSDVDVYTFVVPTSTLPVRVSLAWDDYEATFNANPTLINNLDLELVAPSGTIWQPWILNPAIPASNATRGTNTVDNQEQVVVPNPEIGTWIVRVRGVTAPQGPQDYSLACEGCKPLDAGVCQAKVAASLALPSSLPEAQGPQLNSEGDERHIAPQWIAVTPEQAISAGEQWQRSLESGLPSHDEIQLAREQELLLAFDAARAAGPEAVVTAFDTLTGHARDLAMDEAHEAREQLAALAPAVAGGGPVSPAAEQAALAAQRAVEAAGRARALAPVDDSLSSNGFAERAVDRDANQPTGPAVDHTVGNGCAYPTIAAAIGAAGAGDRLLIEGGRAFTENITIDKNLTLQGGYGGCASGSPARTTIRGTGSDTTVVVSAALSVTLQSLDITNGSYGGEGGGIRLAFGGGGTLNLMNVDVYSNTAQWGGGIWVGPNAGVVATSVNVYSNTASASGGGLRLFGGHATLASTSIFSNIAPSGGGVYATREFTYSPSLNLPSSTDIRGNVALTGTGFGGGVYLRQGSLSLADNSDIYSNDAIDGGGVALISSTLTIAGSFSEIENNTATGNGGGVYAQGSTVNLDDAAELFGNNAGVDGSGAGGGAYLDDSDLFADKAIIWFNTADDFGGGMYATNGSVVDMDLGSYACASERCSRLSSNTATTSFGGGIYATGSSVAFDNIFVESNIAVLGGGVYAVSSSVTANGSVFARNDATGGTGDGIRLFSSASWNGSGDTLAYNDAGGASTGRAIDAASSSLSLSCSIVWGHASSINAAGQAVTYSDIQGGYPGAGNLDTNPVFVAPGLSDYHLQGASPVIDRCLSGPAADYDNGPRPVVRTAAASPFDMGADEVSGVARVGVGGGCAYGTIQEAVNAAGDGATVRVSAGTYFENVSIGSGKVITIEGGYDNACATSFITNTTRVDGSAVSASASVFDVDGSVVTLRNLQIAWGSGTGGGVDADNGAQVTLDNTDVHDNHGTLGGGIYVGPSGVVTITNDSDVHDNTASVSGGGARVWGQFFGNTTTSDTFNNCASDGGGFSAPGGSVILDNADVVANDAAGPTGKGGGVYLTSGGAITLTNSAFVGEIAPCCQEAYNGGGIYADNSSVYLLGSATSVLNNTATNDGGGIYLANNSTLQSSGARIGLDNSAASGNDAVRGAGLYVVSSTVNISNTSFQHNTAGTDGGAIYANNSSLHVSQSILRRNSAARGGAIYQDGAGGLGHIANSLVYSNTTSLALGAGIRAVGGIFTMTHATVANNTGGTGYSPGGGASSYIYNSIIWGNTLAAAGTLTVATCNIDQGGMAGPATDPQFAAPGAGENYRLRSTSPARDACATGLSIDLDGVPRPFGSQFDMGAYEYADTVNIYLPIVLRGN